MVDRGGRADPGDRGDPGGEVAAGRNSGWRGGDDVRAERQLRVDVRLLVVGGGEDPEVDPEGEQQSEHDQAAVDRGAAPAGADELKPGRALGAAAGDALG